MAMAQLLDIRMPGSYEVTFPPQNAELDGKGPAQPGTSLRLLIITGLIK